MNYDLCIIGSGPGGYRAADYAAKNGLKVLIFEDRDPGGTCLNRGCIPTKTLCHDADVVDVLRKSVPSITPVIGKVYERLNGVVSQLRTGVESIMSHQNITFVRAHAALKEAHTVVANGEEYSADNIIIATGALPKLPPIDGIDSPKVVTSDDLLTSSLTDLPSRLIIIGAGVVGMEFASVFSRFGCKVTVVEFLKECLPAVDSDIAKRMRRQMEKQGVEFFMQAAVKSIDGSKVNFERKGKENTIEADKILVATGRRPNIEGLNLETLGVDTERGFVVVDDNYMTGVAGIYAIGDVNGRQMLAHAATMQGIHVVNKILGKTDSIRFDVMPAAVFSYPEVAFVGKSEDDCRAEDLECRCRKAFYRANGKALAMDETEGLLKLLSDSSDRIIGCHVYGAHAADIVQEVAVLMNYNATVAQLCDIVHIHPTLSEILQSAAEMP